MTEDPRRSSAAPLPQIEQAMAFHRQGDLANAERLYRQVLVGQPSNADVKHLLGAVELHRGRLDASVALIEEAVRLDPEQASYHNSLGEAHRMQGRFGQAVQAYRAALQLSPTYSQALGNLGMIVHAGGDFEEAISLFQRAIDTDPNNWDLHNNLGVAHQALGELQVAAGCFEKAINLQPQHVEACHNLSMVHKQQGNMEQAEHAARLCVTVAPDEAQAQWNLADIETERGKFEQAEWRCRRAIELDGKNAIYHHTLARIVRELGRVEESMVHNRLALQIDPTLVQAYNDLGVSELAMGNLDNATASFTRAIEVAPDFPLIYENLTKCKKYSHDDKAFIKKIESLVEQLGEEETSGLNFSLGKIHDDLGEYSSAFEFYAKANAAKRATIDYNPDHQDAWTSRVLQVFNVELIERLVTSGHASDKPLFVLGMPRAGTSLVEQILASHSQIFGAGELTHFYEFTQELPHHVGLGSTYPDCCVAIGEAQMQWMSATYLSEIDAMAPAAHYVTDKMPMNFLHLGLIAATFPNAKIVLCERDMRDTCLSIFFQNFAARNHFAYDLYDIGRFYRQYVWAIKHWCDLFGERIIRVQYDS